MHKRLTRKQRGYREWDFKKRIPIETEMSVEVRFKGYEDPGQSVGPAEHCFPPEGSDERMITGIWINGVCLPPIITELVAATIKPKIDGEDLPDET
jgi:hypothetical protein